MAYRGELEPRIACEAHPAAESVAVCSRCRATLCDPCTLYFSADAFCRRCIASARRGWALRLIGGVGGVLLTMAFASGVMLAAVPQHASMRAARQLANVVAREQHEANCVPEDRWLRDADRDLASGRPYAVLHDLGLSQRDCGANRERDRLYAEAYARIGDRFAAIAAAVRYVESTGGSEQACVLLATTNGAPTPEPLHPLCRDQRLGLRIDFSSSAP
jgi:hypothetical protein